MLVQHKPRLSEELCSKTVTFSFIITFLIFFLCLNIMPLNILSTCQLLQRLEKRFFSGAGMMVSPAPPVSLTFSPESRCSVPLDATVMRGHLTE